MSCRPHFLAAAGGLASGMSAIATDQDFARCGSCHARWPSWEAFVTDVDVRLLGFQGYAPVPEANLLVFEHRCGSTVSIRTARLRHLLPEMDTDGLPSLRGTEQCPGHCRSLDDMGMCDLPCAHARERELIRIVREMQSG